MTSVGVVGGQALPVIPVEVVVADVQVPADVDL